jgi:uncharacterized protein YdhG (YjbR/CyaY superfamily)
MRRTNARPATFGEYSRAFPTNVQHVLRQIRVVIKGEVSEAKETISYGMPATTLMGRHLVYFAGYERRVSLYPVPRGTETLRRKLRPYQWGRGTLRLPLSEPLSIGLVRQVVRARAREVRSELAARKRREVAD